MKIKEKINEAILKESLKEERERNYLYASDIFQCQRKILLEFNKLKVPWDARTLRVFDNGKSVHERVVKYLKLAGYQVEEEINIPVNEHNIHGRLDAKIIEDNEPKLLEIKSINLKEVNEIKEEHNAQLHIYLKYTGIKSGYVVYESKQTQELFFFPVEFSFALWERVEKWIMETNVMLKDNKIPRIPVEYKKNKYPCNWGSGSCKFFHHCWGGNPDEKKTSNTFVE